MLAKLYDQPGRVGFSTRSPVSGVVWGVGCTVETSSPNGAFGFCSLLQVGEERVLSPQSWQRAWGGLVTLECRSLDHEERLSRC